MSQRISYVLIMALVISALVVHPASAQTDAPPTGPTGEVMGTIINQNTGQAVSEPLDVMLHVLDQNYAEAGMLHAQSLADGTFLFSDAPFDVNLQYAVMATFEGVTYFSDVVPVDTASMRVNVDVPVYESTPDLANVQVDQMHVLFNFAEDGMETKEIYVLSNAGERTVKDVYQLDADKTGTLEFPLPSDADFVFFKPNDQDRFVKLDGRFADTYPLLPGANSAQIMINYLVPFTDGRSYNYTAPLNIVSMNFLVEEASNVTLLGEGLTGPEHMTLDDSKSYLVYSYAHLRTGESLDITFTGDGEANKAAGSSIPPLAMGAAVLGLALMGVGIWWWRKPDNLQNIDDDQSNNTPLDDLILEIAQLDEKHEQAQLDAQEHQKLRGELMERARRLL